MDVVIYLSDNTGHQFTLPNGKTTPASQLLQIMIATLKLPDALAKKCFALWLKSPLLDVQLKPQHIPFRMVQQWPTFIDRFSMGSEVEKIKDEPALLFRRNAFLTKEEEMEISDQSILDILLLEARSNIQKGLYPCDAEDIEQLGALLCANVEEGQHHEIQHVVRENLPMLIPSHLTRVKKSFLSRQQSMEERVIKCAKKVSQESSLNATLEFMKICWQLPYYGSVIFNGFVEKAQNGGIASLFSSHSETPVRVAVNTRGVWIIDDQKKHVLLGLLYDEFNWEVTDNHPDDDSEPQIASLFLEFEDAKTKQNQLLQIVSKEAPMMNSMIETCIAMLRDKERDEANAKACNSGSSSSKQATGNSTRVRPLFQRQNSVTNNHPEKLSFTKFSESDTATSPIANRPSASKANVNNRGLLKKFGNHTKEPTSIEERNELL